LTFYDGILLSSLPHARATHSIQAELFVSLQDQLQSTHCIYCRFDSRFRRSFVTVLITLANNDLFSIVLKMSAEEMLPKVTTKDGNAPTPASEEKTSTSVKPRRIYSSSKRSTRDFCGIKLEDSDFASNESDAEGTRVPPAKRLKRASRSRDEAGDDDHDDDEEEDKKLPGKLDDNKGERKMPANEDGVKEEQSEDEESRNDSNEVIVIDGEGNDDNSNDDEEEEEEAPSVCVHCGATPCVWLKFCPDVVEYACNNQLFLDHSDEMDPHSYPNENFNGMTEAETDEVTEIQRDRKKKCFKYFTRQALKHRNRIYYI
jgi:hypothetical protein